MSRFNSLRGRLVAWSLVVNALLLIAFGGGVWLAFRQVQDQQASTILQLSAGQLAAAVDVVDGKIDLPGSDAAVLTDRGVFGWVLNAAGQVQATVGPAGERPPDPLPAVRTVLDTRLVGGKPVRLYRQDLGDGTTGPGRLSVVVGLSLAPIESTAQTILLLLIVAIPLGLAVAAAGARFLAGRALAPLAVMTGQAEGIGRANLAARLQLRAPPAEVAQLAGTFNDLLDRLQAAFEHERQFTADASHELRTPLGLLKAQISLALSRPRTAAALTGMLQAMDSDVDRMTRLLDTMLALARIEAVPVSLVAVDLAAVLREQVAQVTPQAAARGTALALDVLPQAPMQGDPDRLGQLFRNLVDNAIKYAPGGQVRIRLQPQGDTWQVAISDSGPGIAPESLPHLFDRFYRADPARARATGGVGLGLAIAQAVAHQHGGRIAVVSRPGAGSTFTVWLPGAPG